MASVTLKIASWLLLPYVADGEKEKNSRELLVDNYDMSGEDFTPILILREKRLL